MRALLEQADRQLDGWSCEVSTDCCHFGRTGRTPYLWPNEWALLDKAIRARGGLRVTPPTAREQPRGRLPVISDEGRCPLLGPDDRCTVYASRPFGCRTFFCERATGPTRRLPRDELARIGRAVADLAQREDPACDGPRTLTSWLAQGAGAGKKR